MKAKNSFVALNERQVLRHIGTFGEDFAAALLHGEVVSGNPMYPFADVVNTSESLAIQVKMCNGRHAQRPLPSQITNLYEEIDSSFLFSHGAYAFVFYKGIENGKHRRGKSKIWSRKFSQTHRREIIARELQYIYILDVKLLHHMVQNCREHIRRKTIVFAPDEKPLRENVLYLNRTFMKGFLSVDGLHMRDSHLNLLTAAFGRNWRVLSLPVKTRFDGEHGFSIKVPVHCIGTKRFVTGVKKALLRRLIPMSLKETSVDLLSFDTVKSTEEIAA